VHPRSTAAIPPRGITQTTAPQHVVRLHGHETSARCSVLSKAVGAHSKEIETMRFDFARNDVPDAIVDVVLRGNGEVSHRAAAFADEVVVLVHRRIIAMDSLAEIEFANLALRREDVKVTVNGTERDTWK